MKKLSILTLFLLLLSQLVAQKIAYRVSFPNAIHHEAQIELTVSGISTKPAIFKMSRSSPGRYATHEFGKNVYDVMAKDVSGKSLTVERRDGDIYEVPNHSGEITLAYTLYGNYADGTYAGIDPESIHLNMPASFMWMVGMDNAPITISFELPRENKGVIATQLVPSKKPTVFTAPNLPYFMDSPVKIGDLTISQWPISNKDGNSFTMRIALESDATQEAFAQFTEDIKKLTEEARAVFGEYPSYDYGTYTFIASANPFVKGDGMEHRNSTMITIPSRTFNAQSLLGVFSHEFFHCWNVERIRPKSLEPFNFSKSNMSNELWFAEGFTQYYGELILTRAGLLPPSAFLQNAAGLVNAKLQTPGAKWYTPVQASNHAVFVDAAVSIDKNNYPNMFTSYYTYGAAIAFALDLEMQNRYGKTLDTYMQAMWKRFGKTEIPYTLSSMEATLASVTDGAFAQTFFSKYIKGHEPIDYAKLLVLAGYDLVNSQAGNATMELNLQPNAQGRMMVLGNASKGTPGYLAGLDTGDEIVQLDGREIKSANELSQWLQSKKPGDEVSVSYFHRNQPRKTTLMLSEKVTESLVPFENSNKPVTSVMQKTRNTWFNSKVN